MNYTNPRLRAVVEDWPSGSHRVMAIFQIEWSRRGERATRQTQDPRTIGKSFAVVFSKPKKLTYAVKARIVDGDDGRIYIAELGHYGTITIMRGTMDYQHEVLYSDIEHVDPRYADFKKRLFGEVES